MTRMYELRQKEVINICDGCRLGYVSDLEIDCSKGIIITLIIPGSGKLFGLFGHEKEYRVPWDCIKQIGEDLILIECDTDEIFVDCD